VKVGEVEKIRWYELQDGEVVSFHTAFEEWPNSNSPIIFYSNKATWPSLKALDLDIEYQFMRNSTPNEVDVFLIANPDVIIKKVIEV
jgi:hypothetical protein